MSRQQIIEKIEKYTPAELERVSTVLEEIEKRRGRRTLESLAGAWADIDDDLKEYLTDGLYKERLADKIDQHTEK